MAALLFPDTTVLINFALLNRMDLLAELANGHGRWCLSIAEECHRSSAYTGLSDLGVASSIFGEPLVPGRVEMQDALLLRDEMAQPGDSKDRHMGEAETMAVVLRRALPAFFVTDDRAAARLARRNGLRAIDTWSMLKLAYRADKLDAGTLWCYVQTLRREHRGTPPGVHDRASCEVWADAH